MKILHFKPNYQRGGFVRPPLARATHLYIIFSQNLHKLVRFSTDGDKTNVKLIKSACLVYWPCCHETFQTWPRCKNFVCSPRQRQFWNTGEEPEICVLDWCIAAGMQASRPSPSRRQLNFFPGTRVRALNTTKISQSVPRKVCSNRCTWERFSTAPNWKAAFWRSSHTKSNPIWSKNYKEFMPTKRRWV